MPQHYIDLRPHGMTVGLYESVFRDIESGMVKPEPVELGDGNYMLRMPKRDIPHAIVLKLAKTLSALNAAFLLLREGHVMEQAVLQRTIDEANEDVQFLSLAIIEGETELHRKFLKNFWDEEFEDFAHTVSSHKSRDQVPRKKIHAANSRLLDDPSGANAVANVIHKTYSGFVHGAAPHIMEIYDDRSGHFLVRGMHGTHRVIDHADALWNAVYRTGLAFIHAANALGMTPQRKSVVKQLLAFQQQTGRDGGLRGDPFEDDEVGCGPESPS